MLKFVAPSLPSTSSFYSLPFVLKVEPIAVSRQALYDLLWFHGFLRLHWISRTFWILLYCYTWTQLIISTMLTIFFPMSARQIFICYVLWGDPDVSHVPRGRSLFLLFLEKDPYVFHVLWSGSLFLIFREVDPYVSHAPRVGSFISHDP